MRKKYQYETQVRINEDEGETPAAEKLAGEKTKLRERTSITHSMDLALNDNSQTSLFPLNQSSQQLLDSERSIKEIVAEPNTVLSKADLFGGERASSLSPTEQKEAEKRMERNFKL